MDMFWHFLARVAVALITSFSWFAFGMFVQKWHEENVKKYGADYLKTGVRLTTEETDQLRRLVYFFGIIGATGALIAIVMP